MVTNIYLSSDVMICECFQIANLGSVYHLVHDNVKHRSRRSAEDIVSLLLQDPNVCTSSSVILVKINIL